MAKVQMKYGQAVVTFDADTPKAAVETAHYLAEIFDVSSCRICGSVSIRPEMRSAQENKFYGWRCNDCGAQLDLGQHKNGKTLFQKKSSDKDNRHESGGWYQFQQQSGDGGGGSAAPAQQPAATNQDDDDIPF